MPKNNPNAYKNRNGGTGDDKKKKQLSRYKGKESIHKGTANLKTRTSKSFKKRRAKGRSLAERNIARMMGESPSSMHNGYSAEDNKKVSKPEFKRKKKKNK